MGKKSGFTLVELSIALVIIGLIVGGVLVGRDLISAAGMRAVVAQKTTYNSVVNTSKLKYNAMPGDINGAQASSFGFAARGPYAGQGDGNGLIEGIGQNNPGYNYGYRPGSGECAMFWVDLSQANLIDGNFSYATAIATPGFDTNIDAYFPKSKLAQGTYMYVWSGGATNGAPGATNNINYFGVSGVAANATNIYSTTVFTPGQAYDIDSKIDDGLPQSGKVQPMYPDNRYGPGFYAAATPVWNGLLGVGASGTAATPASETTCFDNNNAGGATQRYTVNQGGKNCNLSFAF